MSSLRSGAAGSDDDSPASANLKAPQSGSEQSGNILGAMQKVLGADAAPSSARN